MGENSNNDSIWLGFIVSLGLNASVATLVMVASLVLLLGMGMSSNREAEQSVWSSLVVGWVSCPLAVNLPGLGYSLVSRKWVFLRGWIYGLAITLLYALLCAALLAGYVFLLVKSE